MLSSYKIHLSVTPEQQERLESEKLIPDMPVKAFIKTRERTVPSYLLKPSSDYLE